jgi:8-oxo-dGTP diphosphatase
LLVVAAALIASDGVVLLQRRRIGAAHGGLWEFPGGKVEAGESPEAALVRELDEELGLSIDPAALVPVGFASGPSSTRAAGVVILLYKCRVWQGEPECRDAEEIAWFEPSAVPALTMPPLDYPLAQALIAAFAR